MAQNNFSFVIDSSFTPFTMQEMLTPFAAYKDVFEKSEEAYSDISKQAGDFEYLRGLPETSKARQVYEGYANYLDKQFKDFSRNGLSLGNRRGLSSLKRRFQGEIGRLIKADEALKEEKKFRRTTLEKDSSMIYATNNLQLDDFMDGNTPNLYGISGNELYARGAAIGKAESSRIYSSGDGGSTLGGYYRKWCESQGYTAEQMAQFSKEAMEAIRENFVMDVSTNLPDLWRRADALLMERGVTENLKGYELQRARMAVINGIIDGAITVKKDTPMQDLGVLTAAQKAADAREGQRIALQAKELNWRMSQARHSGGGGGGGSHSSSGGGSNGDSSSNEKGALNKDVVYFDKSGNLYSPGDKRFKGKVSVKSPDDAEIKNINLVANKYPGIIAPGTQDFYQFGVIRGGGNDGNDIYIAKPRGSSTVKTNNVIDLVNDYTPVVTGGGGNSSSINSANMFGVDLGTGSGVSSGESPNYLNYFGTFGTKH